MYRGDSFDDSLNASDRVGQSANFHSQQIDDTVNVMKKNLESVAQRGEHIDQLQDKSENLNQSAQGFRRGANRVRKQMWWKNMKMRIWIIVGIIILLLIIIIPSGLCLASDCSTVANITQWLHQGTTNKLQEKGQDVSIRGF